MKHEIELTQENIEAADQWVSEKKILYAQSTGGGHLKKSLYRNLVGGWELEVDNKLVWSGLQTFSALEEYNKY